MQIGKIARATGTKVNTVRYYEEIGLLKPAPRSQSGRRIYADADVERLAFIRRARGLGFSVSEVRSLLEVSDAPNRDCKDAATLARNHLRRVEEQIEQLQAMRQELIGLARACDGGTATDCGIIGGLARKSP